MRNGWALGFVCTYIYDLVKCNGCIYYPSLCVVGSGCCDAAD